MLRNLFSPRLSAIYLQPNVLVDFIVKEEALYLSIYNLSYKPAYEVRTEFGRPLMGNNGSKNIAKLPLIKNIPYLAPQKKIELFVDPLSVFFYHLKQKDLSIRVNYKDEAKKEFEQKTVHNFDIYKDLPTNSSVNFIGTELF